MTNNWNAGGRDQAIVESRGLVLSSILSPISNGLTKITNIIDDAHDWLIDKLFKYSPIIFDFTFDLGGLPAFGYVKEDLVPYEHLYKDQAEAQKEDGKPVAKVAQQKVPAVEMDLEKLEKKIEKVIEGKGDPLSLLGEYKVPIYYYKEEKEE
jgi:hypothetical protein